MDHQRNGTSRIGASGERPPEWRPLKGPHDHPAGGREGRSFDLFLTIG